MSEDFRLKLLKSAGYNNVDADCSICGKRIYIAGSPPPPCSMCGRKDHCNQCFCSVFENNIHKYYCKKCKTTPF